MGTLQKLLTYYRQLAYFRETSGQRAFLTDNLKNIVTSTVIMELGLLADGIALYLKGDEYSQLSSLSWLVVCLFLSSITAGLGLGKKKSIQTIKVARILATVFLIIGVEILYYYELKLSGGMYTYLISIFFLAGVLNYRLREVTLIIGIIDLSIIAMVWLGIPPVTGPQLFLNQYHCMLFCSIIILPMATRAQMHYMQRIRQYAKLERDSETDPLTGMYNRRGMETYVATRNYQRRICVAIFDIDDFKAYNDTYGHAAGDFCLKQVAACLRRMGDKVDSVPIRYGGEEFVVLFYTDDKENVSRIIKECMQKVRNLRLDSGRHAIHPYITLSGGLILAEVSPGGNAKKHYELIAEADKNLYKAKTNGKNQLVVG